MTMKAEEQGKRRWKSQDKGDVFGKETEEQEEGLQKGAKTGVGIRGGKEPELKGRGNLESGGSGTSRKSKECWITLMHNQRPTWRPR